LSASVPHYLEVQYEELVRAPEVILRRICAFAELAFHPAMLDYHTRARDRLEEVRSRVGHDGKVLVSKEQRLHLHQRTSNPPTSDRVGRWKHELTADEVVRFHAIAGDLLADLGYASAAAA
jgi:hypothetical protein